MGFLEETMDTLAWGAMGPREAAARGIEQEVMAQYGDTALDKLDSMHRQKYKGRGFLEGEDLNAVRTVVMDFVNASQANAVAASSFANPDYMRMADAFGMDNDMIDKAMSGYQAEVSTKGKALLNTLATIGRETNGAFSTTGGGKLSPEETDFIFELIGSWQPNTRVALELENRQGAVRNSLDNKYGNTEFTNPFHENFGRKSGAGGSMENLTPEEQLEAIRTMDAAGMPDAAQILKQAWNGDLAVTQMAQEKQLMEWDECYGAHGGSKTQVEGVTFQKMTKELGPMENQADVAMGPADREKWEYGPGPITTTYDSPDILLKCVAKNPGNLFKQGQVGPASELLRKLGFKTDDIMNVIRHTEANEMLWGVDETSGYINSVKRHWLEDTANINDEALTGVKVEALAGSEMAGMVNQLYDISDLKYLPFSDKDLQALIAMEIAAKQAAGEPVKFYTGSAQNPKEVVPDKSFTKFRDYLGDNERASDILGNNQVFRYGENSYMDMFQGVNDSDKLDSILDHTYTHWLKVLSASSGSPQAFNRNIKSWSDMSDSQKNVLVGIGNHLLTGEEEE